METKTKYSQLILNYPVVLVVITQVLVLFLLRNFLVNFQIQISGPMFALTQGAVCFLIYKFVFKLPKWFLYLAFIFPIVFYIAFNLHLHASVYGVLFVFIFLTFSHTLKERVPLYLSNDTTSEALRKFLEKKFEKKIKFIDLGSGTGRVVRKLSHSHIIDSYGTETAPTLFLYSMVLSRILGGKILRKSIWDIDLNDYDCAYTFLSPAVMDKIHLKFKNEMRKNSILISNSFPIENLRPSEVITLNDQRKTKFYIYIKE